MAQCTEVNQKMFAIFLFMQQVLLGWRLCLLKCVFFTEQKIGDEGNIWRKHFKISDFTPPSYFLHKTSNIRIIHDDTEVYAIVKNLIYSLSDSGYGK